MRLIYLHTNTWYNTLQNTLCIHFYIIYWYTHRRSVLLKMLVYIHIHCHIHFHCMRNIENIRITNCHDPVSHGTIYSLELGCPTGYERSRHQNSGWKRGALKYLRWREEELFLDFLILPKRNSPVIKRSNCACMGVNHQQNHDQSFYSSFLSDDDWDWKEGVDVTQHSHVSAFVHLYL